MCRRNGVVTQLARSSFMQEVNRGIEKAAQELKEKGIQLILKEGLSVDEEEQLQAIEELEKEGIRGLAVMPVDSEAVRVSWEWITARAAVQQQVFWVYLQEAAARSLLSPDISATMLITSVWMVL